MLCYLWERFDPLRCQTRCGSCRSTPPNAIFQYNQPLSMVTVSKALNGTNWQVFMKTNVKPDIATQCDIGFSLHTHSPHNLNCTIQIVPRGHVFFDSMLPYPPTFTRPNSQTRHGEWITKCSNKHRGTGIRLYPRWTPRCSGRRLIQKKVVAKHLPGFPPYWTIRTFLLVIGEHMFVQKKYMWVFSSHSLLTNQIRNFDTKRQHLLRTVDANGHLERAVINLTYSLCVARKRSFTQTAVFALDMIIDANNRAWLIEVNQFASLKHTYRHGDVTVTKVDIWRDIFRLLGLIRGKTNALDSYRRTCMPPCAMDDLVYLQENLESFGNACPKR